MADKKDLELLNDKIQATELLVIDDQGERLGLLSKAEALGIAQDRGLDLFIVSPNANPPVAKILDYGHVRYEKEKKLKEAKKSGKQGNIKKVLKFSLRIGDHDYNVRRKQGEQFLKKGYKVQAVIVFRGREMAHRGLGEALLERYIEDMKECGTVESRSKGEREIFAIIVPVK